MLNPKITFAWPTLSWPFETNDKTSPASVSNRASSRRRLTAPNAVGDLFLRQFENGGQLLVGFGFFNRIEIFALEIFDERDFESFFVGGGRTIARHVRQADKFGRTPTAFAANQLEPLVGERTTIKGCMTPRCRMESASSFRCSGSNSLRG